MSDRCGLRIGLLGEFTASYDGVTLDLGGPRQRAVLALLVLQRGQTVSVDRIVESLWADEPPATGFQTLQSYVSHLRRRLEPDVAARSRSGVIARQGRGYAVRLASDAVDAWRFEHLLAEAEDDADPTRTLTDALALWRGPALAEYAEPPLLRSGDGEQILHRGTALGACAVRLVGGGLLELATHQAHHRRPAFGRRCQCGLHLDAVRGTTVGSGPPLEPCPASALRS